MCLGFIALMTVANLRGVKESGRLFAGPTYLYVLALSTLIIYGLYRSYFGGLDPLPVNEDSLNELTENGSLITGVTLFALLRAFSSGAVALSGVEAISNGVPAFRPSEPRNAARTLIWMSCILGATFFGVSVLAHRLQPTVSESETLLSIMGSAVFGDGTLFYYVLQFSTFAILILAANTAYADFPRLSSIIARDGFLPRQLANRGDRLVFSNGILFLAGVAGLLVVIFGGETSTLIPLYAVGVFTGFTLSQSGMCVHHWHERSLHWQRKLAVNLVGAIATGIVLTVVVVSKFTIGAWIPAVLIPLLVVVLKSIGGHYAHVQKAVATDDAWKPRRYTHNVVVLVATLNKPTLQALTYARSLAPDRLIALSVVENAKEEQLLRGEWRGKELPIELVTLFSPYRELTRPVLSFLDELDAENPDEIITVVIPEVVVTHWYTQALHNQSALALKARLLFRPNTVVTSVPTLVE